MIGYWPSVVVAVYVLNISPKARAWEGASGSLYKLGVEAYGSPVVRP